MGAWGGPLWACLRPFVLAVEGFVLSWVVGLIELSSGACADVAVLSVVACREKRQECPLYIFNICVSCTSSAFPMLLVCSFITISRLESSLAVQAGTMEGRMCRSSLMPG